MAWELFSDDILAGEVEEVERVRQPQAARPMSSTR